jgi:polyisoprenoid-binding protein YceI
MVGPRKEIAMPGSSPMKRILFRSGQITLLTLVLASPLASAASEWALDPAHTSVQFSVRHMMVSTVRGEFFKVSGTAKVDDADPTRSSIEVTIDASSIDTREPKRDTHLKSPDFFDVEKFPTLTFHSTKIEAAGPDAYKLTGDLTIHGVTKPVMLDVPAPSPAVKTPFGTTVRGASATGTVKRSDFGLTWNKTLDAGGVVIGDEVTIQIDTEFIEQQS